MLRFSLMSRFFYITDVLFCVCGARVGGAGEPGRVESHGVDGRARAGDAARDPPAPGLPSARGPGAQPGEAATDAQGTRGQNHVVRRSRQVLRLSKSPLTANFTHPWQNSFTAFAKKSATNGRTPTRAHLYSLARCPCFVEVHLYRIFLVVCF